MNTLHLRPFTRTYRPPHAAVRSGTSLWRRRSHTPPPETRRIPTQHEAWVRRSTGVAGLAVIIGVATVLFWEGPLALLAGGALLVALLLLLALVVALWFHPSGEPTAGRCVRNGVPALAEGARDSQRFPSCATMCLCNLRLDASAITAHVTRGAPTIEDEHHLPAAQTPVVESAKQAADFSDLLQELRVFLLGAQVLTAFLIILPFNAGFARIQQSEKWVYLATFACSLSSLIIFSAPAAQHRLEWPLRDRAHFKRFATRMAIVGLVPLSLSLVLATQLIVAQTLGGAQALVAAGCVAALIGALWWLFPLIWRRSI